MESQNNNTKKQKVTDQDFVSNNFESLSQDCFSVIVSYLDVQSLRNVSILSKKCHEYLEEYLQKFFAKEGIPCPKNKGVLLFEYSTNLSSIAFISFQRNAHDESSVFSYFCFVSLVKTTTGTIGIKFYLTDVPREISGYAVEFLPKKYHKFIYFSTKLINEYKEEELEKEEEELLKNNFPIQEHILIGNNPLEYYQLLHTLFGMLTKDDRKEGFVTYQCKFCKQLHPFIRISCCSNNVENLLGKKLIANRTVQSTYLVYSNEKNFPICVLFERINYFNNKLL